MSEMVGNARYIAQAVQVPLIADADTGFGNAVNVIRTVREYITPAWRASTSRTR
jgi:2-methylisocitrate lyase-like PEP mutase family enzyme